MALEKLSTELQLFRSLFHQLMQVATVATYLDVFPSLIYCLMVLNWSYLIMDFHFDKES